MTGAPSAAMADYIAAEGLDFGMASPARYRAAMAEAAGFEAIEVISRNDWYRDAARRNWRGCRGRWGMRRRKPWAVISSTRTSGSGDRMIPVLESGEHCPTHLKARKPERGEG